MKSYNCFSVVCRLRNRDERKRWRDVRFRTRTDNRLLLLFRLSDHISGGLLAEGLSVAMYDKSVPKHFNVELSFQSLAYQTENERHGPINVLVDRVSVFDTEGNT